MDPRQAVTGRTLETLLAAPITRLRLRASYALCQQMARYRAGNFYYSFLILPKLQRLAMCSLYAFMRVADDLADEEAIQVEKCRGLESWRCELESSLQGQIRRPLFHALVDTVKRFGIPP
ncbi:MAG TPA: squalene/phytoene synthase family protein, partial [Gemmatales bacterium]|nr:squalene/phytoene synthase family protein [Gemmatales bacterium]